MALEVMGAFAAGAAAGWIGRSLARSTRGIFVGMVTVGLRARDSLTRLFGHTAEWVEDVIAEGRAQYDAARDARADAAADPAMETPPNA